MRVLHVTPYYEDAWAYGGIPRVVGRVCRGLAQRRHEVVVCTTDACDETSRVSAGGRPAVCGRPDVRVFPNISNRAAYDWQFFLPVGLGAYLRRHARGFDIAHLHGCHHIPGAIAARHLLRAGVPYVLSPHGTAPRIERRRFAKYLFDVTIGRGVLTGAARVVAVSEAERRQLLQLGVGADAIEVIPNPIDAAEFEPRPVRRRLRERLAIGDRPLVAFLGKLTPRKRLDVLVDAFARLERDDAVLVIAGNDMGAGRGVRAQMKGHGIESRTFLLGLVTGRERLDVLAAADVAVYPGRDEVFGLVALEAIMAGTPVIVADDSGCAEVIHDIGGGQVVREGDARALAMAIGGAIADPVAARRSLAGARARAMAIHADDRIASLIEALYVQVAGPPAMAAALMPVA